MCRDGKGHRQCEGEPSIGGANQASRRGGANPLSRSDAATHAPVVPPSCPPDTPPHPQLLSTLANTQHHGPAPRPRYRPLSRPPLLLWPSGSSPVTQSPLVLTPLAYPSPPRCPTLLVVFAFPPPCTASPCIVPFPTSAHTPPWPPTQCPVVMTHLRPYATSLKPRGVAALTHTAEQ